MDHPGSAENEYIMKGKVYKPLPSQYGGLDWDIKWLKSYIKGSSYYWNIFESACRV